MLANSNTPFRLLSFTVVKVWLPNHLADIAPRDLHEMPAPCRTDEAHYPGALWDAVFGVSLIRKLTL